MSAVPGCAPEVASTHVELVMLELQDSRPWGPGTCNCACAHGQLKHGPS